MVVTYAVMSAGVTLIQPYTKRSIKTQRISMAIVTEVTAMQPLNDCTTASCDDEHLAGNFEFQNNPKSQLATANLCTCICSYVIV